MESRGGWGGGGVSESSYTAQHLSSVTERGLMLALPEYYGETEGVD